MDAPRHVFYFVIEASDNAALNNAVEPLRLVGKVTIIPIMKFFKEGSEWAKKLEFSIDFAVNYFCDKVWYLEWEVN